MLTFSALFHTSKEMQPAVEVSEDRLRNALTIAAAQVQVDEEWYLRSYPDVRDAIKRGVFSSGREHYTYSGYFEDRSPRLFEVNTTWYLEQYPDVADAIHRGRVHSAQQHFQDYGFKEGRHPYRDWSL